MEAFATAISTTSVAVTYRSSQSPIVYFYVILLNRIKISEFYFNNMAARYTYKSCKKKKFNICGIADELRYHKWVAAMKWRYQINIVNTSFFIPEITNIVTISRLYRSDIFLNKCCHDISAINCGMKWRYQINIANISSFFFEITNIVMISRLCRFDILLNRYRHDIFAINYGDEVTISNQHYNNIITEIDTIMTWNLYRTRINSTSLIFSRFL